MPPKSHFGREVGGGVLKVILIYVCRGNSGLQTTGTTAALN